MSEPLRLLYLSYDGLLDPLGRSQIAPYLTRFARQGIEVTLLSFEKREYRDHITVKRRELARRGIRWIPLRYHKHPQGFSTLWDLSVGFMTVTWHSFRRKPNIVHARGYVVALLALWVKRLTGAKFLFDIRGFWPEERVEGGLWKSQSRWYRITKWWERRFFKAADAIVILAERGRQLLLPRLVAWGLQMPVVVIPTCVDLERFAPAPVGHRNGHPTRLAYVGSVGTWYQLREMATFFSVFREQCADAEWLILTGRRDSQLAYELKPLKEETYRVEVLPHEQVPEVLRNTQASLCFIKPVSSKLACCPTKVGESLACGVPVVITMGVGDCDQLIEREQVGVVVRGDSPEAYRMAAEQLRQVLKEGPTLAERCRRVAQTYFDVERGTARYVALYRQLSQVDAR